MIPTRLTLSNFMCYRVDGEAQALDFEGLHVVVLSGENGAGKSALLDAITWALWGEARMPDDDLIAQGGGEMWVELEFLLGEQLYRVRRARQRGGTGKRGGQSAGKSQLDLMVRDEASWRTLTELKISETQERIDDLLRMSYQTFINASFLLQGRADEFTARTPGERKKVLAEILDLGEYEELEAKAKERAKGLDEKLRGLRGKMESLRESAARLDLWAGQVAEAERQVERIQAELVAAEKEREAAAAQRAELERRAEARKALLRRADELRTELGKHETEIVALKGRLAQAEALIGRRDEIAAGLAALAATRAEVERLDGLRERWQELEDQRKELQTQLREALGELKNRQLAAAQRRDDLLARRGRRDELAASLVDLETRLAALAPLGAERATRAEALQGLDVQLQRLRELRLRITELDGKIKLRTDSLVAVREDKAAAMRRIDEQLRDEPRWRAELAEAEGARASLAAEEARLGTLREQMQAGVDGASRMRAECARLKEAAEKLKANQALLAEGTGACPVCHSELGAGGLARVHDHYEEELQQLRARYQAAKRDADDADRAARDARASVSELEAALDRLRAVGARVEPLAQQVAQAERWHKERDEHRRVYDDVQLQLSSGAIEPELQAERGELARQMDALGDIDALTQDRAMVAERLHELDEQLESRGRLQGELDARRVALTELDGDLAALPDLEAKAAELGRQVADGDFAHEVRQAGRQVVAALETLGYGAEAHDAARQQARELRRWEDDDRALAVAEQGHSRDVKLLEQAEGLRTRDAGEIERLAGEEALLAEALKELPNVLARAEQADANCKERQRVLQVAQNDLGEKRGYLRRAQHDADALLRCEEEERALLERHGLFAELAEAFGKKGVQAMLIDTAIPQIEDEANRLLGRMTDGQMHLSLDTQRDTKKGDTVETLEIKIADALGTRAYDAFSGGEAMRVNFAVRIALSRLLARRAGARLETLVIDEGFGALDALGRERMVEAITSVQDDFRRIIVITHIDELKDRFPAQIEVRKTQAGSRWEIR